MINPRDWNLINQRVIAKALREMIFEEIVEVSAQDGFLTLQTPQGVYRFEGTRGIWGDVRVQIGSIQKNSSSVSAAEFFRDTQTFTKMDDIILANFIEEMHNSMYADLQILQLNEPVSSHTLASQDGENIQYFLTGHPKIINSKGRIGWSAQDQDQYAPENKKPLRFMWVAVRAAKAKFSLQADLSWQDLYLQSLSSEELEHFAQKVDLASYHLVPVHPWQWQRYLKLQFLNEIANQDLIELQTAGDWYLPQISLRTFSNTSRPLNCDIKLPLSILNTSSVRGIPARYIEEGPQLSLDFEVLCNTDKQFQDTPVKVLKELAGISLEQTDFIKIKDAPYRYHELLGAIWRQSVQQVRDSHNSLMTGSLLHVDARGESVAAHYIQQSGLSSQEWMRLYARHVVIPLFHLQYRHGIGIVSHGQNIILETKDFRPCGLILKDFQGDLRLSDSSQALQQNIPRLPAHYLIHDLITGHFITNLRYLSGILSDQKILSEELFYATIGEEIHTYYQGNALIPGAPEIQSLDLLAPFFDKVLINAVRFKVGYADSSQRPLPMLGTKIQNPFLNGVKI